MDAVNALGVRWSPSQHDCPMLTATPSPRARTEVRGWGRGGKQRRADQVLAPEAGGSRNPAARGAGTGLGAGRCSRGGSLPAGSPPALELGPPQGQRGLHAPPPHPRQLCLCLSWFRQPSQSCGPLGTWDPSACIHQASWDFPIL